MTALASFCWWRSIFWAQIASFWMQSIREAQLGSLTPTVGPRSISCSEQTGGLDPISDSFLGMAPNGLDLSVSTSGVFGGVSGICPLSSNEALMASRSWSLSTSSMFSFGFMSFIDSLIALKI